MGPTNSGFIEASNNKLNEGFAIRGTGILKLQLSQKQTPKNLVIHYIRTNTEWNFASIKVFAEGKYIGKLVSKKVGEIRSEFILPKLNKSTTLTISLKIVPSGILKFLYRTFEKKNFKNSPKSLLRDSLLIKEIKLDENPILNYHHEKCRFFSKFLEKNILSKIRVFGFFHQTFGLAEAAKRTSSALSLSKISYHLTQIPFSGKHHGEDNSLHTEKRKPPQDNSEIRLFHFNGDHSDQLANKWGEDVFKCRYSIGFWHWELPEFPNDFLSWFSRVNEIWVPSRFVHNSITLKSPHPVQVIPLALDNNVLNPLHPDRQKFSLPPNTFLFLLTFDFYSSMERKNPIASIRAFSQLIASGKSNTQKVHLVVKTSNAHADPASAESLNEALRSIPDAKYTLIEETLPRQEMLQLINTCDALIALHRSEGFGLHLSEAMAMGKSVLATNWSGNVDVMNETNSYPVNFKIVELQNDTGSYKKSNFWAEVDIEHAVSQMKKVLENEFAGNKMVKHNAKQQIKEAHSIKRVSAIIENRIKFIEYHLGTSRV